MHPDLDDFLETAFGAIQPTAGAIGRVVVEPDYDVAPDPSEAQPLAEELLATLRSQQPAADKLSSPVGVAVPIESACPLLRKYLRSITLHGDSVEGPWVEVAPPGNWI